MSIDPQTLQIVFSALTKYGPQLISLFHRQDPAGFKSFRDQITRMDIDGHFDDIIEAGDTAIEQAIKAQGD